MNLILASITVGALIMYAVAGVPGMFLSLLMSVIYLLLDPPHRR